MVRVAQVPRPGPRGSAETRIAGAIRDCDPAAGAEGYEARLGAWPGPQPWSAASAA